MSFFKKFLRAISYFILTMHSTIAYNTITNIDSNPVDINQRLKNWSINPRCRPMKLIPTSGDFLVSQLEPDGPAVVLVKDAFNGIAGGTVGVMGTLVALELKKQRVQKRAECPYCNGLGRLPCVACLGTGTLMGLDRSNGEEKECNCGYCEGTSFVTCVNCKGDGRAVPIVLNRKASRDPENELEDVGII